MTSETQGLRPSAALVAGAILLLVAFVLAELATFPVTGHRIDTTKWPEEAQGILREQPGVPVSGEQWKRIDKVLAAHGGDIRYGQKPYWSQTVSASWWWFIAIPLVAAAVLKARNRGTRSLSLLLVASPCVGALVAGLVLAHSVT